MPERDGAVSERPARRDFRLVDTSEQEVTLATYEGKWLLIFFGYTNCPDICPTTMINVAATLDAMGARAAAVQPIFITIDPDRDSPALLREYLANFGGNIVGLSGTAQEIAAAAKSYGVYYSKEPTNDGSYGMNHSAALYLVSPTGVFERPYRPDLDPSELAKELGLRMMASGG